MGARLFWKLAALWAAIIFVLSSIPGGAFPQTKVLSYDKGLHAAVYAVLGALFFLAMRRNSSIRTSRLVFLAAALATLYGATDELHQLFVPGRSADWRDVLADCVGGFGGALSAAALPLAKPDRAS